MPNVMRDGQRMESGDGSTDSLLAICNATPDIVITRDLDGRVLFVNQAGREFFGSIEDLPFEPMIRSRYPRWAADLMLDVALPTARENGYWKGESAVLDPQGGEVPMSQVVLAHRGPDGQLLGYSTILRDISEIKRTQNELMESQKLVRDVADSTLDLLYILELPSRRLTYANHQFGEMLGIAPDSEAELSLDYMETIVHPDDAHVLRDRVDLVSVLPDGEVLESELRIRRADGAWRWLNIRTTVFKRNPEGEPCLILNTAHDVTARKRADAEEREMRRVMENALEGMSKLDTSGRYIYANPAYAELCGLKIEELIGRAWSDLVHPVDRGDMVQRYQEMLKTGRVEAECRGQRPDGTIYFKRVVMTATRTPDGDFDGHYCFASDVTDRRGFELQMRQQMQALTEYSLQLETKSAELQDANRRLQSLASNDGLTGIPNHRTLHDRLRREFACRERDGKPISFLLADIDHFKAYNDAFGHPEGDEVLRMVAAILTGSARPLDEVARYGGEEFAVILPGTKLEDALLVAERFRVEIESHAWQKRGITLSIGVAGTEIPGIISPGQLVEAADRALYLAKHNGRNRIECGSPLSKSA
ncbi:MAG: diguanylate cyclase [Fimbriimonadaceae bacterium]|nr:diguanylate cyclase [Fimbriimonadaceae bacterium]